MSRTNLEMFLMMLSADLKQSQRFFLSSTIPCGSSVLIPFSFWSEEFPLALSVWLALESVLEDLSPDSESFLLSESLSPVFASLAFFSLLRVGSNLEVWKYGIYQTLFIKMLYFLSD